MLPVLNTNLPGILNEFFDDDWTKTYYSGKTNNSEPAVNILEGKDNFSIEIAAPGLKKEDFKIDLENEVLKVSTSEEEVKESSEQKVLKCGFNYKGFEKSFYLPETVDTDKISAKYDNGILYIGVPKKEYAIERPAREIKIS